MRETHFHCLGGLGSLEFAVRIVRPRARPTSTKKIMWNMDAPLLQTGRSTEATRAERLDALQQFMLGEAAAIVQVAHALGEPLIAVVDRIVDCTGQVVVSGMGKAGLIGQKLSATFASTGTRSIFLHPSEAVHGDLGRVDKNDVLLLLSYSGETDELNRLLPTLKSMATAIVAITSSAASTLGRAADHVLELGALQEVCPLGLAPSTSTTVMLALVTPLHYQSAKREGLLVNSLRAIIQPAISVANWRQWKKSCDRWMPVESPTVNRVFAMYWWLSASLVAAVVPSCWLMTSNTWSVSSPIATWLDCLSNAATHSSKRRSLK